MGHFFLRHLTSGGHGDFWGVGPRLQKDSSPLCSMVCPQRPPHPWVFLENTGDSGSRVIRPLSLRQQGGVASLAVSIPGGQPGSVLGAKDAQ